MTQSIKTKRIIAAFIDLVAIPFLLFFAIGFSYTPNIPVYVSILFNVVWFSMRDLYDGAGPGKRLMHLKVVLAETGEALSYQTAVRGFLRNVLFMIPFFWFISFIVELIVLIIKGERVGDMWAKTKVVEAGPRN